MLNWFFVSILILLEVSLEVCQKPIQLYKWICFNPYFVGSESGSRVRGKGKLKIEGVSILILLEVSLEVSRNSAHPYSFVSFNPYFVGSESGS